MDLGERAPDLSEGARPSSIDLLLLPGAGEPRRTGSRRGLALNRDRGA